jgi:hypothetical protein
MYLSKLYRYNKWLFAAIVFFAAMQLLVTYKRGMVISPWYNYGMFSEKVIVKKKYTVNNSLGRPVETYLISPQQDDRINVTLDNLLALNRNDSLYQQEIVRLFRKAHLPRPTAERFTVPGAWQISSVPAEGGAFWKWYRAFNHSAMPLKQDTAIWNGWMLSVNH